MKRLNYITIFACLFLNINYSLSQNFLNGNFENNTAVFDQINLSNTLFNGFMSNTTAFGTFGDMDIISSNTYCGLSQNGIWYTALTAGGTDAIAMELSSPLVAGNSYTITFWDKGCWGTFSVGSSSVDVGVSTVNNSFGTLVYTAPAPLNGTWAQRTFTFTAPISGLYITVQLIGGGLSDWTQIDNFSFVNTLPNVSISASNDTAICEGSCANISSISSSGTPPYTYSWIPAVGSGAGPFSVCPVSTTNYTVSVTDAAGSIATASVIVTVNPPPVANLDTAGTIIICNASGITLNANSGDYHYTWYHDGVIVQSGGGSSYFANSPGIYQVQVGDNISGCSSMSQTVTVVLGGGPIASINTASSCGSVLYNGGSVTLDASGSNAASYLWSTGQTTASIQVNQPGNYCVTAYDATGCPSDTPACTTVNSANVQCGHNGQKVILCHVPPGNPNNPQTLCIAPGAVPAHLANHPGDCIGPCSLYYPRLSSAAYDEDETSSFAVVAYPNPFNKTFSLELFNTSEEQLDVIIYDVTGRTVEAYSDINERTVIGNNLRKGIYFVEARQGDSIHRIRIVKE